MSRWSMVLPVLMLGTGCVLVGADLALASAGWHADTAFLAGQISAGGSGALTRGAVAVGLHLSTAVVAPPLIGGGLLHLLWAALTRFWGGRIAE